MMRSFVELNLVLVWVTATTAPIGILVGGLWGVGDVQSNRLCRTLD
jgi:hypothetical protein